jgi:DNA topoisomerase-2
MPVAAESRGSGGRGSRGKTVEEQYQKMSQLEHILKRPDTYVGSCNRQESETWVYDRDQQRMMFKNIKYAPALYKIFDEILVNAADHLTRSKEMNKIEVKIDEEGGSISVLNNGKGIPVEMHKKEQCYVPELIFGHLLTSDNYDDTEKRVTGGRNGYGAKLANVFSTKFIVETVHKGKSFKMEWTNNMSNKSEPKIGTMSGPDWTRVTFFPDFSKFKMPYGFDKDILSLFQKRVYDIAATTDRRCKVWLNGNQLPIRDFTEYVAFYVESVNKDEQAEDAERAPLQIIHEKTDRWEICLTLSTEGQFNQVSFVNSICTTQGGKHVDYITDQIVAVLQKKAQAQNKKGITLKPGNVRQHLWVFCNALIENPSFDSQTKERLTSKKAEFGSECELSENFIKQATKCGIVDQIVNWAKAKEKVDISRKMKNTTGNSARVAGIPKLEDANEAGTKNSAQCTLILTEGDSAKALAVAGLSVIGRDYYGVFPLRGKLLNVRECKMDQIMKNAEIQNVLKIVGLTPNVTYDNLSELYFQIHLWHFRQLLVIYIYLYNE